MNIGQNPIFLLPVDASVGGNVYVPPTVCPRPACTAAHAAAFVERTGSARANGLAGMRLVSELAQNSFILEVG